jgi:hypothetical protein
MSDLIFGHTWDDIKSMQQGTYKPQVIQGPPNKPQATDHDKLLLEEIGLLGLRLLGLRKEKLWGVLDRLATSGLITEQQAK